MIKYTTITKNMKGKAMKKHLSDKRKVLIRKHLPLSVRLHYDMIRTLSANKLTSFGIVALVAVLAIALIAGSGFGASGNTDTTASETASVQDDFQFTDSRVAWLDGIDGFPVVLIEQDGMQIAAKANLPALSWKNRLVNMGDVCASETFAVAPNHPAINNSDRFTIDSANLDTYRNRFICFEVTTTNGKQAWSAHFIDLDNPAVSIRLGNYGGHPYIQAVSDEVVDWRVFAFRPAEAMYGPLSYTAIMSQCQYIQAGLGTERRQLGSDIELVKSEQNALNTYIFPKFDEKGVYPIYCFEATDSDGNRVHFEFIYKTYIFYREYPPGISVRRVYNNLIADFFVTSEEIDWQVLGPLDSPECNESVFELNSNADKKRTLLTYFKNNEHANYYVIPGYSLSDAGGIVLSSNNKATMTFSENDYGKYLCFRAQEHSGVHYKSVEMGLNQPPAPEVDGA